MACDHWAVAIAGVTQREGVVPVGSQEEETQARDEQCHGLRCGLLAVRAGVAAPRFGLKLLEWRIISTSSL